MQDTTKPAETAEEFLRKALEEHLARYDEAVKLLTPLKLVANYINDRVRKALAKTLSYQFADEVKMSRRFWGGDEIEEALKELRARDFAELALTSPNLRFESPQSDVPLE